MELLTGRNPERSDDSGTSLPCWVRQNFHGQWCDVKLLRENQMARQEMTKMMQLAIECVSSESERRPTMEKVVHQIEDICELTEGRSDSIGSSVDNTGEGPSMRTGMIF
jgi:hypothetical protein